MKLAERLKEKGFELRVKQHTAVLEYITAIQEKMIERGINQQQLAEMLDKSPTWIARVFHDRPNLTFFTAVEMAEKLGLELKINFKRKSEIE